MIALLILAALAAWAFGSTIARFLGALTVISTLVAMVVLPTFTVQWQLLNLAGGTALWLFGHWLWAIKHRTWRTRLALVAFSRPGLRRLAPIPTNYQPKQPKRWGPAT
ncbi:hypothetical protein GS504_03395 [Rhodococcus hoagii]|nr:hypothetical protein [Prescottella equi]NKS56601.1 hypothetical protein [Prescottella equi]